MTLIFKAYYGCDHQHFRLEWPPIVRLWVDFIVQPLDCPRCMAKYWGQVLLVQWLTCWSLNRKLCHYTTVLRVRIPAHAAQITSMCLQRFQSNMLVSQRSGSTEAGQNRWGLAGWGIPLRWHQWDPAWETGWVGGAVGGWIHVEKEKGMLTSDWEEGLADTSGSHCRASRNNGFCHTLSRVNTVWIKHKHTQAKNQWRSMDAHFQDWATSVLLAFSAIKPTNTFTLEGCDNAALRLQNMKHSKWLTLGWRSHWTHGYRHHTPTKWIQPIVESLLPTNVAFLCIIICIVMLGGLWIPDQPLRMVCEWWITWPWDIPALSVGNIRHLDLFTSFWLI